MAINMLKVSAIFGSIVVTFIGFCIALLPVSLLHRNYAIKENVNGSGVLADFWSSEACAPDQPGSCANASPKFYFGVATAPAHVEDELDDMWLAFARGEEGGVSPVRGWQNVPLKEERLRFWTEPEVELDLSQKLGIGVLRMGVDWGRLVPRQPAEGQGLAEAVDRDAAKNYRRILEGVRNRGMKIMLTLFHHSMPKWILAAGGWQEPRTVDHFVDFSRFVQEEYGDLVDYWVTFNEPHIFIMLSHCVKSWPPGGKQTTLKMLYCFSPFGAYITGMKAISEAHMRVYKDFHARDSKAVVGVAHHLTIINPYGLLDVPFVVIAKWLTLFHWLDIIQSHMDFCGLNYYGQEVLSTAGLMLVPDEEYSETGRGVYPDGLFNMLMALHLRYKTSQPKLRFMVTENGIADNEDLVRRPYLVEHLLAIHAAREQGVPIDGYVHWTVSDNWEWADGYCPNFGLVYVNRSDNLRRTLRPSFYLYQEISKTGVVTAAQRQENWDILRREVSRKGVRSFCRPSDTEGRMWEEGLDKPAKRLIADKDWRFGKYKKPSLFGYAMRSVEVMGIFLSDLANLGGEKKMHASFAPEIVKGEF